MIPSASRQTYEHLETATARLEAREISHQFALEGESIRVLDSVTLTASPSEFVSIIGPSGCGKSTLLSIFTGLILPERGEVLIDGRPVTGRVGLTGYMPQKDLLLPWRKVLDNAALGLELQGYSRREARREAAAWFPRFGLEGYERSYPAVLSGGMRQRAALLRTVLTGRDVLLLDEPLGALDAITRMDMQEWLLGIWEMLRKTIVLVTHDVDEALYLSDRVCVMSPRPGTIRSVVEVNLHRPRSRDEVVTSRSFAEMKRTVLRALGGDR